MGRDVNLSGSGGPVHAGLRILGHIGVTAMDLWDDADGNHRPDRFLRRLKDWDRNENELLQLGTVAELDGKILQWIWMPSQPDATDEDWTVELILQQDGQDLPEFPMTLKGTYPAGQKYGIFETWARLAI